ncbi:hypothetical protein BJ508DRAFT_413954 [Ascobolus immersus RN42]|uniref:AA9 family lytic polysaccharide monooxygenase n=1 Tax=Ascobolus immersus RN42 TaxID=1160509 RepID=A0A3N4IF66_ASCIM|nr:hypothetical protein BJ508DRAFT_413954 [Ascobolus immersus RN42]
MKLSFAASILALAATVSAHTRVCNVFINGQDQGDGQDKYIRSPPTNNPVKDINSQAIRCNVNDRQVPQWVNARAGDEITFEWFHNYRGDSIIELSHKGPVQVWISADNGNSWTKIASEGLNNGQWAVEKLVQNRGKHSARIPSSLRAGDYLFRAEIIALHEGDVAYQNNPIRGAQFYPSCTQVRITQGGNNSPPGNTRFPGAYNYQDQGIVFNLYSKPPPTSYTAPGGSVWSG